MFECIAQPRQGVEGGDDTVADVGILQHCPLIVHVVAAHLGLHQQVTDDGGGAGDGGMGSGLWV
jgi:hypothetical protein